MKHKSIQTKTKRKKKNGQTCTRWKVTYTTKAKSKLPNQNIQHNHTNKQTSMRPNSYMVKGIKPKGGFIIETPNTITVKQTSP